MQIHMSESFTNKVPDAYIGVIIVDNFRVVSGAIDEHFTQVIQSIIDSNLDIKNCSALEPYRQTMKTFGINPSNFISSVEAILTRVIKSKSFPLISPIIDAGNMISMKYKLPVGVHSIDSLNNNDICLRLSDEEDCTLYNTENPDDTDKLSYGEPVYAVGNSIRTRRWIWRQMPAGRVSEDATKFIITIDGFEKNKDLVMQACKELSSLMEEKFGCSCRIGTLTKANPYFKVTDLSESELKIENTIKVMLKGVANSTSIDEIRKKLQVVEEEGRPLRIKLGLDPSAPDIHLGHSVVLRKIRQLQDLGHSAVIIIGDYTGRIGDPTGKSKTRTQLSEEDVAQNADTYKKQIFKIIDSTKTKVLYNSDWLSKLSFSDVIELAAKCTVARLMERDDFKKRYTNHLPLHVHEFFYPLMQAYDSVAVKADVELGGTDQTFNILMGREIQRDYGMQPQITLFMPLLEGLDGVEKMSKSLGNYIGIDEPAAVIYEKVMKIPDDMIIKYYNLCTDVHPDEVINIEKRLLNGVNPRDIKMELAYEITRLYSNEQVAAESQQRFVRIFQDNKGDADAIDLFVRIEPNVQISESLINAILATEIASSKSEIRRLFKQNAIAINNEKINDPNTIKALCNDDIIRVGKNKYFRVKI